MNDDVPDLATVADALAGALTADRQADLESLLAADPGARETFARHERTLTATSRLLAAQPAPALPAAVADSLDAALRAASAARRPGAGAAAAAAAAAAAPGPDGTRQRTGRLTGRRIRRYATNFALAAVVVGGLVLAVTQVHLPGTASDSSSGTAAGSVAAATSGTPAGTAAVPAPTAGAATRVAPSVPAAAAPAASGPRLTGSAPTARPGAVAPPVGTAARSPADPSTADLSAAGLPTVARGLAADRAATTTVCPSRPGSRTSLRPVGYAGAPAWLAVTPRGDTLLAEVTRTVCGGALLTRTVPAH